MIHDENNATSLMSTGNFEQNSIFDIQLTLAISTSLISNNRLSRSENMVLAET